MRGLERIGTRVVLSYLQTLLALARWDRGTQRMFESARLLLVPLVNPVGMSLHLRSNGNCVDLMRNAPVEAEGLAPWHLFGGHRLTPRLPWCRGAAGAPMEAEARALCDFVRREIFPARIALGIDVHSGYGVADRLWFPYAKTREPFAGLAEAVALKELLDAAYARHVYRIEPQSREYLAHGDLWDYFYDEYRLAQPGGRFLPLTLEFGSWLWVKKNWSQFFPGWACSTRASPTASAASSGGTCICWTFSTAPCSRRSLGRCWARPGAGGAWNAGWGFGTGGVERFRPAGGARAGGGQCYGLGVLWGRISAVTTDHPQD